MYKRLLATENDLSATLLRITLGLAIFPHGAQKLFGWFGGHGFSGTMGFMTGTLGIPALFACLAIIAESIGAIGLILGGATRVAAFGVGVTIGVAALVTYSQHGHFFMNWFGNQSGEGIEYHLLAVGIALALMVKGGGRWSIDRIFSA